MFTMAQQCVHCTVHNLIKSAIAINFGNLLEACSKKLNTKWQKSLEPTIISQQILKNILKFITSLFIFILYSLDVVIKKWFSWSYFIIINNQLRRLEIILQLCSVSCLQLLSVTAANGLKISSDRSDIFRVELHIVMTADSADWDSCRCCRWRWQAFIPRHDWVCPSTWPSLAWPLITAFVCQLFSSPVSELARTAQMNRDEAGIEARSRVLLWFILALHIEIEHHHTRGVKIII